MTTNEVSVAAEIKRLGFDTRSAQRYAHEGKLEVWVHKYLLAGRWANPEFSEGLKQQKRRWRGPMEVSLSDLSPAVGPEPDMEFEVDEDQWLTRISQLASSLTDPLALPPLIVEYREGALSVRDGNTRYGAMRLLDWQTCWVILWYNSERDYNQHSYLI